MVDYLKYWESQVPGKGDILSELLSPFYDPRLSFDLKPPAPDLEETCKEAVFWRDIPGIAAVTGSAIDASLSKSLDDHFAYPLMERLMGYEHSLWKQVKAGIPDRQLELNLRLFLRHSPGVSLGKSLKASTFDLLLDRFSTSIEASIRSRENVLCDRLADEPWGMQALRLERSLWAGFRTTLSQACSFGILGDREKDYRPLLALWRSGNLPGWFDREGRLLVLCEESG